MTYRGLRARAAVEAVCTDMHRPYLNAVARVLPQATVVLDVLADKLPNQVTSHSCAAKDEPVRNFVCEA